MQQTAIPGITYIGISTPFYCINEHGELLLHKRSKNCRDEVGKWDTGAGQLEFGEDPVKGVLRELKEEYGCTGTILEQVQAISVVRKLKGRKTHWLALPFIIKVKKQEVKNNEPKKIDAFGWFSLNNLPSPMHSALKKHIIQTDRIKLLEKHIADCR